MEKSKRLFGTNGIRGIVNIGFTPEFAVEIGEAIGTLLKQGNILIGTDGRTSNVMLTNAMTSGLVSTGCNVYDVGIAPTPTIQYAVKNHMMDGGIVITASHNPPEYNGVKVIGRDGVEISRPKEVEVETIFFQGKVNHACWCRIGRRYTLPKILEEYNQAIRKQVDAEAIKRKNFRVVVDAANGVGGLAAPHLLRELGCQVTTINAEIDGTFPNRSPEPKPENLHELASTVKATAADFGVAFDGDGDRSIFVDEQGRIQWGDRTFALVAKDFLEGNPGETLVTPVSSSQVITDVAEKHGGNLVLTKVGSTIVSHTMKKLRAKLGGEENGGVFYGPHQPVRDGAMTVTLILNVMAKTGRKLSQLLDVLPLYFLAKDKIECTHKQKTSVHKKLVAQVKHLNFEDIDGVKLRFPDRSSILIRPSGTEPVYRIYAEAKTKERARALAKEYKCKLKKIISL